MFYFYFSSLWEFLILWWGEGSYKPTIYKNTHQACGVIALPLRAYETKLYENIRKNFGVITLPLRESRLSQLVGDAERGIRKN